MKRTSCPARSPVSAPGSSIRVRTPGGSSRIRPPCGERTRRRRWNASGRTRGERRIPVVRPCNDDILHPSIEGRKSPPEQFGTGILGRSGHPGRERPECSPAGANESTPRPCRARRQRGPRHVGIRSVPPTRHHADDAPPSGPIAAGTGPKNPSPPNRKTVTWRRGTRLARDFTPPANNPHRVYRRITGPPAPGSAAGGGRRGRIRTVRDIDDATRRTTVGKPVPNRWRHRQPSGAIPRTEDSARESGSMAGRAPGCDDRIRMPIIGLRRTRRPPSIALTL